MLLEPVRCVNCQDFTLHLIEIDKTAGTQSFECLVCRLKRIYIKINGTNSIIKKDQLEELKDA